jgi:ABC-type multidrug transport system permease subunit
MFAGFFLPYSAMPVWWSWIYWVNPLSYMLYGIIASQLGDVTSAIVLGPGQVTTVQLLLKGEQCACCRQLGDDHAWVG